MGRPPSSASEHFPVAVVGLHGLLAATTIVLVLLTNVGVVAADRESLEPEMRPAGRVERGRDG
jgi:hypothetical protein